MRAPQLVEVASLHPGFCFTCGTVDGPLIDTMVDVPGDGRLYVCVRNCLGVWARLAGFEESVLTEGYIAERDATIEQLRGEVERMRPVYEPVAAAFTLSEQTEAAIDAVMGTSADDDEPEQTPEPLPDASPVCTATKKNGQPCTAQALPGRDVCLAHAKKAA